MGEYNLGPEKILSSIKYDFCEFWSIPGGKYRIAEGQLCDVISLKVEKLHIFSGLLAIASSKVTATRSETKVASWILVTATNFHVYCMEVES